MHAVPYEGIRQTKSEKNCREAILPTEISSKKNKESMASSILILMDLDFAMAKTKSIHSSTGRNKAFQHMRICEEWNLLYNL